MDVGAWLRGLGLGQYEGTFRDSEIEADILPELTEADLEKIGLPLGPRKRVLKAIQNLDDAHETSEAAGLERSVPAKDTAERRQLTVMFCDLVGSTAISARLDPEDLSSVFGAFQKACVSAVTAFGGSIAKYMGDGALVYFGYPEAHEDDAERAVRAGLALLDTVAAMQLPLPVRPQVRIGIATGLVVVGELIGEGGAQERVAIGETLNLAARIQAVASPDSVLVAELTRRLAGVAFDYEDLGSHELKGIQDAARLWRVTGHGRRRTGSVAFDPGISTRVTMTEQEALETLDPTDWTATLALAHQMVVAPVEICEAFRIRRRHSSGSLRGRFGIAR